MRIIKVILLLSFIFLKTYAAKEYKLNFNIDVVVCKNSVSSLTLVEQKIIHSGKDLDLFSQKRDPQFYNKNLETLYKLSPERGRFAIDILAKKIPSISYQNNVNISRVSPVSALVIPQGCQVEPLSLSQLNMAPEGFVTYINNDLFQRMSLADQFLSLMELSLSIEQAISLLQNVFYDSLFFSEINFDLVVAREFLRCWYSSACRPSSLTLAQSHQLFTKYKFSFLEQSGLLIPTSRKFSTSTQGLISIPHRTIRIFKPLGTYFNSLIKIGQTTLNFSSYENIYEYIPSIVFERSGNIQCLPLDKYHFPHGVTGIFNNQKYQFHASPIAEKNFPICFSRTSQVTQGFISFKSLVEIPFRNSFVDGSLTSWDSYNKDYFGVFIRMYPNGAPNLLFKFKGKAVIQNKKLTLNGPLKLRPDGSVECALIAEPVKLQTDKMQIYNYTPKEKNILCFNERQQLYKVVFSNRETSLIYEELPSY